MLRRITCLAFVGLGLLQFTALAGAQAPTQAGAAKPPASPMAAFPVPRRIDPIRAADEIPLYPNGAPAMAGAPKEERWDAMGDEPIVRNVVAPTLTPYLPTPSRATGAAVLVAPGGAFMMLAIKEEGWDVGRWLADHGIAAFVLKYRVNPSPADETEFDHFGKERMAAAFRAGGKAPPPQAFQPAIDDGVEALGIIRQHAAEWHLDPSRVGMIGFSAGAMTTLSVELAQREQARPAFIGLIYGPMGAVKVPADAPPLFVAIAADDPLFGHSGIGVIDSWHRAGKGAELHIYQASGHGFGIGRPGMTTELWPEEFYSWLKMNGVLAAKH